jgi:hypothetical protein
MPKILYATVLLACVVISRPVHAQQSLVLNVGHFAVRGIDTRVADDVLLENLNLFAFDISDFNNGTVGAEWLVGLGDHFDVGVGLGFYQRTVLSVYNDFVDFDGTEIEQDFRLRVVPVTATVRVLPFGRTAVQPYFGLGLGLFNWRYSEVGEFVDFDTFDIFRDRYVAEGNDIGAIILGGVRFPVGDKFSVGGELKYQSSTGTVGIDQGFLNERIDLGGLSTQFTVGFTF